MPINFKKLAPFSLFTSMVLVGYGCGQGVDLCTLSGTCTQQDDPSPVFKIIPGSTEPETYSLSSLECQTQSPNLRFQQTHLNLWKGYASLDQLSKFKQVYSNPNLNSQAFAKINYGEVWERVCDATRSPYCVDENENPLGWRLQNGSSTFLRICAEKEYYPRYSYERTALSSIYFADKAREKFEQHSKHKIEKISLSVLPHFIDYYEYPEQDGKIYRHREYIVHNAAFFPASEMMVIFPESKNSSNPNRLWESGFVIAHEYAHYLESSMSKNMNSANEFQSFGYWDPIRHRYLAKNKKSTEKTTDDNSAFAINQIRTAVSEAFADLIALYTETDNASLVGIPCLGENRNPLNPFFGDKSAKNMDQVKFTQLIDSSFQEYSSCQSPSFSDPHTAGAVIAFVLNQSFTIAESQFASNQQLTKRPYQFHYGMILNWFKSYYEITQQYKLIDSMDAMHAISLALEKAIIDEQKSLGLSDLAEGLQLAKEEICATFNRQMPVIDPPFASFCHSN